VTIDPYSRTAIDVRTPLTPISLAGLRVLLVDDDIDQLATLTEILAAAGAAVDPATSAHEAMHAMAQHVPHVIVSDISMPGCDGYHLLRMVRARSRERGGATPAIALSAMATPADRTRALLASYQLHLAKPIRGAELVSAIRRLADARSPSTM
jgi:CheY-like chemotaxis protein